MNKESLKSELSKLHDYLNEIKSKDLENNKQEAKIVSHTIVGMIMTINNIIKTGAYNQESPFMKKLETIVENARNTAIHYGYFSDINIIKPNAIEIIDNSNNLLDTNFADTLSYNKINETFSLILPGDKSQILEQISSEYYIVFRNNKTKEELLVPKQYVIILENKQTEKYSYLLRNCNSDDFFFKQPGKSSIKVNYEYLQKINFFKEFKIEKKPIDLDSKLEPLVETLNKNKYSNALVCYRYNQKNTKQNIHAILHDFVTNNMIDERLILGKYEILDNNQLPQLNTYDENFDVYSLLRKISLSDLFFMELFIKRYKKYLELSQSLENNENTLYTKQSMLINLFQIGASHFSDEFILSDEKNDFANFYYNYKKIRNYLAHNPLTNDDLKLEAIKEMEKYSEQFYDICNKILGKHTKNSIKNNLSKGKKENNIALNKNKKSHHSFSIFKHLGECKLINDTKYVKLDNETNDYLQFSNTYFLLDYGALTTNECIANTKNIHICKINEETGKISKSNAYHPIVPINSFDADLEYLFETLDILRAYPQYNENKSLPIITFIDKEGNATYSEGLKSLIYRKFSRKIIPNELLEMAGYIKSAKEDEPITIVNKKKEVIAKVYIGVIKKENSKEIVYQLLPNCMEKEIDYGTLLPKDLKTNEITVTKKGVKRR